MRALVPELFSAPVLQGVLDKYRRERLAAVPFVDGLMRVRATPAAGDDEVLQRRAVLQSALSRAVSAEPSRLLLEPGSGRR